MKRSFWVGCGVVLLAPVSACGPSTPSTPIAAVSVPTSPELKVSARVVEPGSVEFTVTTNLPTPLGAMASLDLQGQKDTDTAIGSSERVTLTGPTTTFKVMAVNNDNGMDGKPLAAGSYDADVIVGTKWKGNEAIASLPQNVEAKQTLVLSGTRTVSEVVRKDALQKWVIETVSANTPWNEAQFRAKLGSYEKVPSTLSRLHDAYYFPQADMTLIVNRLRREVSVWRVGRTTE